MIFNPYSPTEGMPSFRHAGYRITYSPSWSQQKPWCVYLNGSAINQYESFFAACAAYRVDYREPLQEAMKQR